MLTAGQSQALSGRAKLFAGRQLGTANGDRGSLRQPQRLLVQARAKEAGVGIFGTKAGMTQIFTRDGLALPATVIALEEGNIVTQVCAHLYYEFALQQPRLAACHTCGRLRPHHTDIGQDDGHRRVQRGASRLQGHQGEEAHQARDRSPCQVGAAADAQAPGVQGAYLSALVQ